MSHRLGEQVIRGGEVILSRAPLADRLVFRGVERPIPDHDQRPGLRIVADADNPAELAPPVPALTGTRVYRNYNLWGLQTNGSRQGGDLYLHPSGQNAFSVLRNWRDRRDLRPQYDFVVARLKSAFPQVFEDAGIPGRPASPSPSAWSTRRGTRRSPRRWPPTAGSRECCISWPLPVRTERSVVAIDDFGNDLHPYAIRALIRGISGLGRRARTGRLSGLTFPGDPG